MRGVRRGRKEGERIQEFMFGIPAYSSTIIFLSHPPIFFVRKDKEKKKRNIINESMKI